MASENCRGIVNLFQSLTLKTNNWRIEIKGERRFLKQVNSRIEVFVIYYFPPVLFLKKNHLAFIKCFFASNLPFARNVTWSTEFRNIRWSEKIRSEGFDKSEAVTIYDKQKFQN